MKKTKTLLLVLSLISLNIFSQDKTVEIKIEGKRTLTGIKSSQNGIHLIKTAKHIVLAKYKDGKLKSYDNDLNLVYDIDIKENDFSGNPFYGDNSELSNFGNYYYNVNQLIDKKGNIKPYNGTIKSKKKIYKESGVNPIFDFFSDYGYSVVGPAKGRKNHKKKYSDGDIQIWTLKNEDLTTVSNQLESPEFQTNRKKNTITWYLGETLENSFLLMTKDLPNESRNINTYTIASHTYDGKLDKLSQLRIQLDNGHFTYVKTNLGIETAQKYELPGVGFLGFDHIKFNPSSKTFFVYGFYNVSPKNKIKYKEITGLYIQKFDFDGNLLWKKQFPLSKKIKITFRNRAINFIEIGDIGLLDYSIKNLRVRDLITLNIKNGEKLKYYKEYSKNYKPKNTYFTDEEIRKLRAFFSEKSLPKKHFSPNVIFSFYSNKKIKEYMSNVKNKSYLYYDATFNSDGSIILKEFSKKNRVLKLLKFTK